MPEKPGLTIYTVVLLIPGTSSETQVTVVGERIAIEDGHLIVFCEEAITWAAAPGEWRRMQVEEG